MRVLLHYGDEEWSARARFLSDAALLLLERGARVAITCRPGSVAEQRFGTLADVMLRQVSGEGSWMDEGRRLRRVLSDLFGEVVVVHTGREHLAAGAALRSAGRGAILRRIPPVGALAADGDGATGGRGSARPRPPAAEHNLGRAERMAALMASSGFIVTSEEDMQSLALPRRPLPPAVVPLGVDVESHAARLAAPPDDVGHAMEGRLLTCVMDGEARPRVATVLRTVALLAERHPSLRLLLVGPGSDDEDLRMHAAALGIIHRVHFLGERTDTLGALAAADVGWVVATGDAAAYGALDLMALGVPVVAERDPIAARYLADGITGVLLPPADAPASAAAIATLLAEDDARNTMGSAGSLRVARDFPATAMGDALAAAVQVARDRNRWRRA